MRIHGVTPEFIRRVEKAGYRHVPVDKLVQMRIFNVDPEMVRALDDAERCEDPLRDTALPLSLTSFACAAAARTRQSRPGPSQPPGERGSRPRAPAGCRPRGCSP